MRRLSAFRLLGLTVAFAASVLMLVSSQLSWIHTTSPVAFDYWIDVRVDNSGGLDLTAIKVLVIAALAVAVLAALSLIPYLRFLCAVVVVIGGVCIALTLGVMSEINKPGTSNLAGHIVSNVYQRSPGIGIYVLIAGSTLAIISGALTLLTPRTVPRYQYGIAPYGTPEARIAALPRWQERAGEAADTAPVPVAGWFPKVSGHRRRGQGRRAVRDHGPGRPRASGPADP